MEQMALLQETSYERLYRWTQSRTKCFYVYEYYCDDSFNSFMWIELSKKPFQDSLTRLWVSFLVKDLL